VEEEEEKEKEKGGEGGGTVYINRALQAARVLALAHR